MIPIKLDLKLPDNNIVFFQEGGKEVMRITDGGKLVAGPNLSQDEATQATFKILKNLFDNRPKYE